jgi:hypothetical protein
MVIDLHSKEYRQTEFHFLNPQTPSGDDSRFTRNFVFGDSRSTDFGIESMLYVADQGQHSVKGLYWESAKANRFLSSYLATLAEPPVVLDYFYYYGQPCAIHSCILDHFIQDYQIGKITLDPATSFSYMRDEKKQCYQKILQENGTQNFIWARRPDDLQFSGRTLWTYAVNPTDAAIKAGLSQDLVQILDPSTVRILAGDESQFHQEALQMVFHSCQKGATPNLTFIPNQSGIASNYSLPSPPQSASVEWARRGQGDYEIQIHSPVPIAFKIKLHYYPGLKLFDEKNQEIPLIQGYPHLIAVAKGTVELKYVRPWYFYLGYWVSSISFLVCLLIGMRDAYLKREMRVGRLG